MDRLTEILSSKEFKTIPPITQYKMERIRKESSRYIIVTDKNDRKHGKCERCQKEVDFKENTKHKTLVKCPSCGHELRIEHIYRKKGCDYNLDYFMEGRAISKDIFVLRYYEAYQFRSYEKRIEEVAREIFDFKSHNRYRVNTDNGKEWFKGKYHFIEFVGIYTRSKHFCLTAEPLQTKKQLVNETKKIEAVKYYDFESKLGTYYCLTDDYLGLLSAPLYEKLEKVGLQHFVEKDFGRGEIKWNGKETSLVKMLKLDKRRYKKITPKTTIAELKFLQSYKNISDADYEYLFTNNECGMYRELKMCGIQNPIKVLKYYRQNKKLNWWEFKHYLSLLREMKYDMTDTYYTCPKDFRKADKMVSDAYIKFKEEQRLHGMSKQTMLIKKISDGLRNMEDLKEFMTGTNGLLVYVPESAKELLDEGKALNNCIGTYVDRIAENKTLVFFVRKLNAPDEPFVAFEYCNGEVIQCRYDHNESVTEDTEQGAKIISFVDAFANRLRKNNVLYKAA